jgi:hypothetical protein
MCVPSAPEAARRKIVIVSLNSGISDFDIVGPRLDFYTPDVDRKDVIILRNAPLFSLMRGESVLIFRKLNKLEKFLLSQFKNVFFIDHRNYIGAWDWVKFSAYYYCHQVNLASSRQHLSKAVGNSKSNGTPVYVFGTGPSLARALEFYRGDGDCIVCNTIVRDKLLFKKLNPKFVVAGDALYHFSYTEFAKVFRNDLKLRLRDSDAYFVYPSIFDVLVQREFCDVRERLIPIPVGTHKDIHVNLVETFTLPNLGNVLPLLQLPLASTMSNSILLCGYDGRSPYDSASSFWGNSNMHSYPELMHTLKSAFPFFFDFYVPNNNSKNYISSVHGDVLEERLTVGETRGFTFEMLHPSWTSTFAKRYRGAMSPEDYYKIKEKGSSQFPVGTGGA